ncbi:MAG: hypothetical protein ACRCVE_13045 [Plesiomonas sp.]
MRLCFTFSTSFFRHLTLSLLGIWTCCNAPIAQARTDQQTAEIARQLLCAAQSSLENCININQIITPNGNNGQWHNDQWNSNQNNGQWQQDGQWDQNGNGNQNNPWNNNNQTESGRPHTIRVTHLQRHYPLKNQQALINFNVSAPAHYIVNAELYNSSGNRMTSQQVQVSNHRTPVTLVVNNPGIYTLKIQANNGLGEQRYNVEVTGWDQNSGQNNTNNNGNYPTYRSGTQYQGGDIVRRNGRLYQCRPWPNSGWCGQGADHYAPGTGMNWQDAWERYYK